MKGEHFFLTHPVVVVVLAVESLRVMSRIQNRKEKTNSIQVIMYENTLLQTAFSAILPTGTEKSIRVAIGFLTRSEISMRLSIFNNK